MVRGAEERGDDRRHDGGVETVLRRQAGDDGERNALGKDDDAPVRPASRSARRLRFVTWGHQDRNGSALLRIAAISMVISSAQEQVFGSFWQPASLVRSASRISRRALASLLSRRSSSLSRTSGGISFGRPLRSMAT